MIIGLDIDDVIFDTSAVVREMVGGAGSGSGSGSGGANGGAAVSGEVLGSGGLAVSDDALAEFLENKVDIMKGDVRNPVARKFLTANLAKVAELARPLPGAVEGIRKLRADGHKVILVTARGDVNFPGTEAANEKALAKYGIECDGIIYNGGTDKVAICREHGIELFVDDSPKNCVEVSNAGIPVIGFRSEILGEEMLKTGVKSVGSWEELEGIIIR